MTCEKEEQIPFTDHSVHVSTEEEEEETCQLHGEQESEGPVRGHVTVQLCNEARQYHH